MELYIKRFVTFILLIILLLYFFKIYGFFNNKNAEIIRADGIGYYSYLPAIFIYNDYKQEFVKNSIQKYNSKFKIPEYIQEIDNHPVDKYFFGTAVMMLPFFFIAHILAFFYNQAQDGYSLFYQYLTGISGIFYVILGMCYSKKLLYFFNATIYQAFFISFIFLFGTNLFFYAAVEPTMSHAFSFAVISGFLFYSKSIFKTKNRKHILVASFCLGLIILIRPINFLIIFALPFIAGDKDNFIAGTKFVFKNYWYLIIGIIIIIIILSLQSLIWYKETGNYFVYSYTYERFNFSQPNIINVLFSYRKGLFIYTPISLLSVFGLIIMIRKNLFSGISILLFLIIITYIFSCWHQWYYGSSFGFRPMTEYYSLFAILLLMVFNYFKSKRSLRLIFILCGCLLFINQVQAYQYRKFILHWENMTKFKYWKVFMRTDKKWDGYFWDNPEASDIKGTIVSELNEDFEILKPEWSRTSIINAGSEAHSGNYVMLLDGEKHGGDTLNLNEHDLFKNCTRPAMIISGFVKRNNIKSIGALNCIISFYNDKDKNYFYKVRPVDKYFENNDGWRRFEIAVNAVAIHSLNDKCILFFECGLNDSFWIDDISVQVISQL